MHRTERWVAGGGRTEEMRLQIEGHADASGNAGSNLRLSQARAEAVKGLIFPLA